MSTLDLTRNAVKSQLYDRINEVMRKSIGVWGTEGMRLTRMAADVKNGVIVEIGSHRGRSAAFMASALSARSKTKIYCVDLWSGNWGGKEGSQNMRDAIDDLTELGLIKYVELLRGDSVYWAEKWQTMHDEPQCIDLLHIDGAHQYADVKRDFEAWYPFLKPGGMIAFHDYGARGWPGVKKFVDEAVDAGLIEMEVIRRVLWTGHKK